MEKLAILSLTALLALSCKGGAQFTTPTGGPSADAQQPSQSSSQKPHSGHHYPTTPGMPPLAATPVSSPSPGASSADTANDPCASLPSPSAQSHCGYDRCDQVERIRITCDLKNVVQDHYSGFYLKNKRLTGFDSESHLSDCVKLEAGTTDNDEVAFTDRMKECVAGFQDTHFRLETVRPLPVIQAPILVSRVQGHYYVTGMISKLLKGDLARLTYGTEILAVDGQEISAAAGRLVPFIPASSRAYGDDMAARALFMRQFAYPTTSAVRIKAKLANGRIIETQLPWTYLASADRLDTHVLFTKAKISPTNNSATFNSWQEYSPAIPLFAKTATGSDLGAYARGALGSDPSAALRTGIVSLQGEGQGQQVGYLQILTFNSPTVYGGPKGDQSILWLDAVRGFVKSIKSAGLNLVIDLRWNEGGDPTLADQLLGILAEPGKTYGGGAMAYRTTDSEKGLLWGEGSGDLPASFTSVTNYFTTSELARIFSDASQAKALETPILVNGDIQADAQNGGYSGQITALISDQCISACDRMAALLDRSGRATLIGTPSNGTGLGYANESLFYDWTDWHGLLSVKIPAHIFGVAPAALGTNPQDHILPFDSNADAYLTENRPTSPQKSFEPTIQDVMNQGNQGSGWTSAIQKTLPAAPQPSP